MFRVVVVKILEEDVWYLVDAWLDTSPLSYQENTEVKILKIIT